MMNVCAYLYVNVCEKLNILTFFKNVVHGINILPVSLILTMFFMVCVGFFFGGGGSIVNFHFFFLVIHVLVIHFVALSFSVN